MKLTIVILDDNDADQTVAMLLEQDFRVTRVASTGGFLRRGNTTLLIGSEDERVDACIELIRQTRSQSEDEDRHRATIFVLDMAQYEQF